MRLDPTQILQSGQWRVLTSSESNTASERIVYNALPGRNALTLRWVVTAFSGSGQFTLEVCLQSGRHIDICLLKFLIFPNEKSNACVGEVIGHTGADQPLLAQPVQQPRRVPQQQRRGPVLVLIRIHGVKM
jgi:hypothetical protein